MLIPLMRMVPKNIILALKNFKANQYVCCTKIKIAQVQEKVTIKWLTLILNILEQVDNKLCLV